MSRISQLLIDPEKISKRIRSLDNLGIDFSIISKRIIDKNHLSKSEGDELDLYDSELIDEEKIKYTTYFRQNVADKIQYLYKFASNNDIEYILNAVSNEIIAPDQFNYFCSLDLSAISNETIKRELEVNFNKIYGLHKFNRENNAFTQVNKYLITGFLAYRIKYKYKTRSEIDQLKKSETQKL